MNGDADGPFRGSGRRNGSRNSAPLLDVEDLRVTFEQPGITIRAVRGISYQIGRGEALGLVGESGAGKSVSALALLGLIPRDAARVQAKSIRFDGKEIAAAREHELRKVRGIGISMIFQDPLSSLNPVLRIGKQITEQIRHHLDVDRAEAYDRAVGLLQMVGIPRPEQRISSYPHEFSGGMRQRAMIAMALSCGPALLIADEPTTALDVTIQSQILDLIGNLRRELGMALLIITHDLGVIANSTDRVAVMYAGHIVEQGPTRDVLADPIHPYTQGLLRSLPRLDNPKETELTPISGDPPELAGTITGCPFRPRCPRAMDRCRVENPSLAPVSSNRVAACWAVEEISASAQRSGER